MRGSQERVKIFGQWQWKMPRPYPEVESAVVAVTKTVQARKAQEMIVQAQLLLYNIAYFKDSKREYVRRKEECVLRTCEQLNQLYVICNDQREDKVAHVSLQQLFIEHLRKLYLETRRAKLLQNEIALYFKSANLANYDKRSVKIEFTKSGEEVRRDLEQRVQRIDKAVRGLREAAFNEEIGNRLSNIFGREYGFDYCLQHLSVQMGHRSLIEIHYLMLYQLQELQLMLGQFSRSNVVSEGEYLKYEAVYDCLSLMKEQREEMRLQRGEMAEGERRLMELEQEALGRREDRWSVMGLEEERGREVERNLEIYYVNLENFKRVNVEINMYLYSLRKSQFVSSLGEFQAYFEAWKGRRKHIQYLFERYDEYLAVRGEVEVNGVVSEGLRRRMSVCYNEVVNYDMERDSEELNSYRERVVRAMELFMSRWGMVFSDTKIYRLSDLYERTRKQRAFFGEMVRRRPQQHLGYVRERSVEVKIYLYEIEQMLEGVRVLAEGEEREKQIELLLSLRAALRYCLLLSVPQEGKRDGDAYSMRLAELEEAYELERRWYGLPEGMDLFLFNYVNDLVTLSRLRKKRKNRISDLEETLRPLVRNRSKLQVDRAIENSFTLVAQEWHECYRDYFRELSAYGESLLLRQLGQLAEELLRVIAAVTPRTPRLIDYRKMEINKSEFYSYGIQLQLRELLQSGKCARELLRIVNVQDILGGVFEQLDKGFITKSGSQKVSEVLKLTLLEDFFNRVYQQEGGYTQSIRCIKRMAFLQLVCEWQTEALIKEPESVGQDERKRRIGCLLDMQIAMGNLLASGLSQTKVLEGTARLLREMRQQPLTFAVKHDIAGFQSTFRYEAVVERLRRVGIGRLSLQDASTVFVSILELRRMQRVTQTKWELYENVVVKRRKTVSVTFEDVSYELRPKIAVLVQEMGRIEKAFRSGAQEGQLAQMVQALLSRVV